MHEIVLETENLSYVYPDGNKALCDVFFRIEKTEKVFFHGANGAGKTTLFQCLNGLLKPRRGTVRIGGTPTGERERMRRLGIVFQNASDQIISGSVFDEIAFGPLNQGLSHDIVTQRVEDAMQLMDIVHLRNKPPHFLSYGEKKRVAIASVLSMKQDIVLMDEPTSGLDARQREELSVILDRLTEQGKTLIVATHDADFSFQSADRIIVLDRGNVVCAGTPEDVFSRRDILDKTGMIKPAIMRVHELLVERTILEPGRIPKSIAELSNLLREQTR